MDCFLRVVGDNLRAGSSQESISETIQEFDNHRSIVTCLCWYVEGEKGNGFVDSWEMILEERRRNHGPQRMRSTDKAARGHWKCRAGQILFITRSCIHTDCTSRGADNNHNREIPQPIELAKFTQNSNSNSNSNSSSSSSRRCLTTSQRFLTTKCSASTVARATLKYGWWGLGFFLYSCQRCNSNA